MGVIRMALLKGEEIRNIPVSQGIIKNTQYVIMGMILATIAIGVVTGYYYDNKEYITMFVPLSIAFVTTFIAYMFIDLRSELVAENKEKAMYLCRVYFLVLLATAVCIGIITGYYYDNKEYVTMFIPLLVAFICVCSGYLFIEIRGELEADKLVDPY